MDLPDETLLKLKLRSLKLPEHGNREVLYQRLNNHLDTLTLVDLKKITPKGVRKAQNKDNLIKDLLLTQHNFIIDSTNLPIPKTIVDIKKDNNHRSSIPKTLKEQVWKTYAGSLVEIKCLVCNNKTITAFDFDCAHVVAHAEGGTTTVENLRPTCRSCNLSMGTQNLESFCRQYFPNAPVLKTFPKNNITKPPQNGGCTIL